MAAEVTRPHPLLAWLRNGWRQLTSMRTALVLLFLLALAAIPGSILPQRTVNIDNVNAYIRENPELAPLLDRLGFFDVFASPWFSAIYLLLFVSLVGCIVPRLWHHLRALRRPLVAAPKRLDRLPQHQAGLSSDGAPADVADDLRRTLRRRRWRATVRQHDDGSATVTAEKGYLKESGNILMHLAMVAVLIGVALGSAYGWHGNRLVVAGPLSESGFCNTLSQYDEFGLGTRVDGTALPGFCFALDDFEAEFTEEGLPTSFLAHAEVTEEGAAPRPVEFTVNSPLRLDGAGVYLLGHGQALILRYTDQYGESQTITSPFLPIDPMGTAEGLVVFPDANVGPDGERDPSQQIGFEGLYLPTAPEGAPVVVGSAHPEERDPQVMLLPYRGDLGLDDGVPQSVWALSADQLASGALTQAGDPEFIGLGETMTLDDGTTIEFLGTERWITVSVRSDPGHPVVLTGVGLLIAGLIPSLLGKRRRVWFRVRASDDDHGRSLVEAGGLPRSDYPGFAEEFRALIEAAPCRAADPTPAGAGRSR
ncbi:cytochrome c biogenesis protein ResB [Natronosporangium hydrolyticum]|uniref:Cytochrome c biogenesis protein ResB n=1 Tax=Natronosporangium hydrolyticum TaxID=2811111 RepID=A0A895YLY7_9ACTN|nr:cytochrome c biogenesis protein ResB [Natronosporangium hydrolyticum]QSB14898.1 cytochrome c biogenesis protein ResB [Natronosporangium hydrolyticum]